MSLDVMRVYNLECDAPDCLAISEDYVPNRHERRRAAAEARRIAYASGWTTHDGRDLCPEHSP